MSPLYQTSQLGTRANLEIPQVDGQHGAHEHTPLD